MSEPIKAGDQVVLRLARAGDAVRDVTKLVTLVGMTNGWVEVEDDDGTELIFPSWRVIRITRGRYIAE